MSVFLLVVGIVLFIGLVVIHEFGHFVVARRNGVEAEEFSIFFGPKLWGKKIAGKKVNWRGKPKPKSARKSFDFSIRLLPIGGYVKLKGEHDSDRRPGTFGAASTWAKTKIMAAGIGMNFLVALILFLILAWVGMPQLVPHQFAISGDTHITHDSRKVSAFKVDKGSPAARAGLEKGDTILAIGQPGNVTKLNTTKQLVSATNRYAGQTVLIKYKEHGKTISKHVALNSDQKVAKAKSRGKQIGHLGVVLAGSGFVMKRSTWSAPVVAVGTAGQLTKLTFQGLGKALAGVGHIIAGAVSGNTAERKAGQTTASSQVAGPVGVYAILKIGSQLGFRFILMIVAIVSLSLAIINVLPVPALDGGKLFITYISRAVRRPVSEMVENYVYGISFLLLIALIGVITYNDVHRFF
jgi:regulator of sigma E protease